MVWQDLGLQNIVNWKAGWQFIRGTGVSCILSTYPTLFCTSLNMVWLATKLLSGVGISQQLLHKGFLPSSVVSKPCFAVLTRPVEIHPLSKALVYCRLYFSSLDDSMLWFILFKFIEDFFSVGSWSSDFLKFLMSFWWNNKIHYINYQGPFLCTLFMHF